MEFIQQNKLLILVIAAVVVIGGILLFRDTLSLPEGPTSSQEGEQPQQSPEEEREEEERLQVRTVSGEILEIMGEERAMRVLHQQGQEEYTVRVGETTTLIQLTFPFDINNPPSEGVFTPERTEITFEDFEVGDQIFLRSSHPVRTGEDIVDPLEIQILP